MAETVEELLDLALKSKELEKKLEYCTKYLALNPKDRDVWDYKGSILGELGKNEESIRCFEQKSKGASLHYLAAGISFGTEEAIKSFNAVLKEEPNSAGVWVDKGTTLLQLKRFEEAIVCFDKALKLESKINEPKAWAGKASALLYLEKYEEALACFNNSLEIDPGKFRAWYGKGFLLLNKMGKYEEALTCFNEVLEILKMNPDNEIVNVAKNGKKSAEQRLKEQENITTKKGFFKRLFG